MALHYWVKVKTVILGNPVYQCAWCGLRESIPSICKTFGYPKEDEDNFDITCALLQRPLNVQEKTELWFCPVTAETKRKYLEAEAQVLSESSGAA